MMATPETADDAGANARTGSHSASQEATGRWQVPATATASSASQRSATSSNRDSDASATTSTSSETIKPDGDIDGHNADVSFEAAGDESIERSQIIGDGFAKLARWSLRLSIVILTLWILQKALAPLWVIILPLLLGLIISTVLWPPTAWLRKRGFAPAAAAATTLVGALALFGGIISALVPVVANQAPELATRATEGVNQVKEWVQGPPLNVPVKQIDDAVATINDRIQSSSDAIASGVFTGVTTVGSVIVTLVLSLILSFFFIKDGDKFLPWVRVLTGEEVGEHITEVFTRAWHTLSGFIRTQAIVSLIDSVFIGAGLLIMGVPLAIPLSVLTFFGGFVPIVGAFVAGALAVLVALVTQGVTSALIVLAIVVAVQQIEGHVLQPMLQSRSMSLHPVLVLLGIAAGSDLYGVVGGFLAVPFVATMAVLFRYLAEQVDLRAGAVASSDLQYRTARGLKAAQRAEHLRELARLARLDRNRASQAHRAGGKDAPVQATSDPSAEEPGRPAANLGKRLGSLLPGRRKK